MILRARVPSALVRLGARRRDQVAHADMGGDLGGPAAVPGRGICWALSADAGDLVAGETEGAAEQVQVHVGGEGQAGQQRLLPEAAAALVGRRGEVEIDHRAAAGEMQRGPWSPCRRGRSRATRPAGGATAAPGAGRGLIAARASKASAPPQ